MSEIATQRPATTYGCGGCQNRWSGVSRAHCCATQSVSLPLFPLRDGDAAIFANRYPHAHQRAVDVSGITGQLLADLLSAHPAAVQPRSLRPPADGSVFKAVVLAGSWTQVLWSVVGAHSVDVVNLVLSGDPSVEDAVLVGLDVLLDADFPAQQDVSVGPHITTRYAIGNPLPFGERSHLAGVARQSASVAKAPLTGPLDGGSAPNASDHRHDLSLQVSALCHRTFNGVDLFDRHRVDIKGVGTCLDPATIVAQPKVEKGQPKPEKATVGERVMWETNGVWFGVEVPAERGQALAAWREQQAAS